MCSELSVIMFARIGKRWVRSLSHHTCSKNNNKKTCETEAWEEEEEEGLAVQRTNTRLKLERRERERGLIERRWRV